MKRLGSHEAGTCTWLEIVQTGRAVSQGLLQAWLCDPYLLQHVIGHHAKVAVAAPMPCPEM